ncbi:MAG: type II toxin-antitoxin system HigB family toxin [Acidobacteriota bacterium]
MEQCTPIVGRRATGALLANSNIMGNNCRLIARIDYGLQTVTLKHFLTHEQYDRDKWKKDC